VNSPTFFRWFRRVLALCVIVNVVFLLLDAIDGGLAAAFGNIIAIALCTVAIVAQTATIRRMDRERLASLQPHPDYSSIAAMEQEIYGETFEHEGAPKAAGTGKQSGLGYAGATMPQTMEELEELVNDDARMAAILQAGRFPDFTRAYDEIVRRRIATTGKAAKPGHSSSTYGGIVGYWTEAAGLFEFSEAIRSTYSTPPNAIDDHRCDCGGCRDEDEPWIT
jgi:hypothetical protein